MTMRRRYLALAALAFAPGLAVAEDDATPEPAWDVAAPPLETRAVEIDVEEGTWMSLDVSPDGGAIAFDLLGDIYTIPMSGGAATAVASGIPWEIQPRFSPDGSRIAFTSDRGGGDNIWIMNADGSDKRQLTRESFRLLNNPTWSPDGHYLAARKHFTTQRSLGTGEIWLYHVAGGDGVPLVERPSEQHQKELGEPMFSPDGRSIYYTRDITPGATFQYAQDSNADLFDIERYEMATGRIETAVSGYGGSVRPTPSPDGRFMAFVRRERTHSRLFLKDLHSGEERELYDELDRDLQEVWGVHGLYPNMDWTPDSESIVFWAGGRIRKLDVPSGDVQVIPFRVSDTRAVVDPPRPQVSVAPATFRTTMPRFAAVSPDGRQVVFESLGKLYVKALPDGAPRRLSQGDAGLELFPSWSRDGRRVVYVTWTDDQLGTIRTISAAGGSGRVVTNEPGHYRRPRFSPDGDIVVYEKGEGGNLTDRAWSEAPGVYRIPAGGGPAVRVARSGRAPHFGSSGERIFMTTSEGDTASLISVDLNGADERVHAAGDLITEYQVAPSGDHVAFAENYNAHVMPLTAGPQRIAAGRSAAALPVVKASGDGGSYLTWSESRLNWALGPTLYSADVGEMLPDAPPKGEAEKAGGYRPPETGVDLSMSISSAKHEGTVALTGARVITMADEDGGVIENAVIVVEGDRIAAVGEAGTVEVPSGTPTVDLAGKTVIPGLIDAHAHGPQGTDDIVPEQNWSAIATLALGVTTIPTSRATSSPRRSISARGSSSRHGCSRRGRSSTAPSRPDTTP